MQMGQILCAEICACADTACCAFFFTLTFDVYLVNVGERIINSLSLSLGSLGLGSFFLFPVEKFVWSGLQ